MGGASIQEKLMEAANQNTPKAAAGTGTIITPVSLNQQGEVRISSTSSITSTLDGMVESRISSLESVAEQTNKMLQDMMIMMEKFTKKEEKANKGREQANEVTTMMDQYKSKSSRGEECE